MAGVSRTVQLVTIPVTLLLIVWACLGRGLVDGDGFILDYLLAVIAVVVFTPVMAMVLAQSRITGAQVGTLLAVWASLGVYGTTVLSGGMPWQSQSVLTIVFGVGLEGLSRVLTIVALGTGAVAYATLIALLIVGLATKRAA